MSRVQPEHHPMNVLNNCAQALSHAQTIAWPLAAILQARQSVGHRWLSTALALANLADMCTYNPIQYKLQLSGTASRRVS